MKKYTLPIILIAMLALVACGESATADADIIEISEAVEVIRIDEANMSNETINTPTYIAINSPSPIIPVVLDIDDPLEAAHATLEALRAKWSESNNHTAQYQRLREFATIKNTGTVYLSDIVISTVQFMPGDWLEIWDFDENIQPVLWPVFVVFFNAVTYDDVDDLIEELLAFTGISEDRIQFFKPDGEAQPIRPNRSNRLHDYLLVNKEFYQIMQPYLRLREFASIVNSSTTYYHDLIIRSIGDDGLISAEDLERTDRFVVWFLGPQHMENDTLIAEILDFAGLNSDQVTFGYSAIIPEFNREDFLLANTQLGELANQYQLLRKFEDMQNVPTSRRGVWIHEPIRHVSRPRHAGDEGWLPFRMSLDVAHYPPSEDFIADMLAFTGIDRDFIVFELSSVSAANLETIDMLDEESMAIFIALQAHIDALNAPFWHEPSLFHPVIEDMLPPVFFNEDRFYDDFLVHLYDGDLLGFLPADQILAYLEAIRTDIIEATGIPSERLTIWEEEVWSIIWEQ